MTDLNPTELPPALTAAERDALELDEVGARALVWIDAATEVMAAQAALLVLSATRDPEPENPVCCFCKNGHEACTCP